MAKVTRDDVARLAGTSTAVVSYVINNGPRPVAPATRERVLAAIKELGYRPDRVAQAMASRRTDLIGLIVPDARQPFFGEMAHAVEQAASERGKMVLVGNSDYVGEREVHYLRAFLGMRVSGLILVSHALNDLAAAEIEAWDARVVLLHERPEAIDDVAVVTDDVGGAQLATRHLLEHGYEYVACLGGVAETPTVGDPVSDHVEGWRRAMHEAGRSTEGRLFEALYNRYDAYKVGLELLAGPDRPCGDLLFHGRPGGRAAAGGARASDRRAGGVGCRRVRRHQGSGVDRSAADHDRERSVRDGSGGG